MTFQLGECLLLKLLDREGMSQAEFARRMQCSRQYVHRLTKKKETMSLIFAINASYILNCDWKSFYTLTGSRE